MRAAGRFGVVVATFCITAAIAALLRFVVSPHDAPPAQRVDPDLPLPAAMPEAVLPGFHDAHPRLPFPSQTDLAAIEIRNRDWFTRHARRATSGKGDLYSAILLAAIGRDAVDLAELHRLLLERPYGFRGNGVWLIAVGYDWLYARWTPEQREALGRHLLGGCAAVVGAIREQRLSPYNVYLYNRPLQSLTACAIAVYRDYPEAAPLMNFAHAYWHDFVLPVWRQVMGPNGGWHEGGEYVGIGIGQAMYTVPALWRQATGEDAFAALPGLAGMLDFLVQRTRPDGTQIRLGDAGVFRRDSPDRVPLSIEYDHAAAYSLGGCPKRLEPTAEPWGPLTRPDLCDPLARTRRPLAHHFAGIGLLIARDSWDDDATLVTFKAGDNFWSHSHLDQGSFTIDRRGALAIDSGLYGSSYGSDHHLNYTYQTIAHNTIVVHDPEDTVPMPSGDATRAIANDGGQRRVGSGWGIGPAPIDAREWVEKQESFHTATTLGVHLAEDLSIVSADLTPAYTNALSGKGTFAARTRRVEGLVRTFGYDAGNDIVVVHDRLRLSRPDLQARWLLHGSRQPIVAGNSFIVPGAGGIDLHGTVLLPLDARIEVVGGPGFEYFVAGGNYDEDGAVARRAARRPEAEPGAWRLEVSPPNATDEVEYLVVLAPVANGDPASTVTAAAAGPDSYRIGRGGEARSWRFTPTEITVTHGSDSIHVATSAR